MALQKFIGQIFEKLRHLLLFPLIFSLEIVDRILAAGKQLADGAAFAFDLTGMVSIGGHTRGSLFL
jgi:hypothetical protein